VQCFYLSLTELWLAQQLDKAQIHLNTSALGCEITRAICINPSLDNTITSALHPKMPMVNIDLYDFCLFPFQQA